MKGTTAYDGACVCGGLIEAGEGKLLRVFLDDVRMPPEGEWSLVCRSGEELIPLILAGVVTFISFDHDLGSGMTGYDVAKEIEKQAEAGTIPPVDYKIHSANIVGRNNIKAAMEAARRFWNNSYESIYN